MSALITKRVLIIGLGLIGGSFAAALKRVRVCETILGNSRNASTVKIAVERDFIDRGTDNLVALLDELEPRDVIVIATPTLSIQGIFQQLREVAARGVIVTDVASVKGSVVEDARAVFGDVPKTFVPAHPIAGSEKSGINAVDTLLFARHEVILTPLENTQSEAVDVVTRLWEAVGAQVSFMSAAEHDHVLALTSHLPHMLAFNLVDTLAQSSLHEDIFRYAAGGFRDFTRIAGSNPTMWHDIALANRTALLAGLDDFTKNLVNLRLAITESNSEYLLNAFTRAQKAREHFSTLCVLRNSENTGETP